jgi:hypothetical protein
VTEKKVTIALISNDDEIKTDDEEPEDLMFKVIIDNAEPSEVKVSKKNVCTVTIVQSETLQKELD